MQIHIQHSRTRDANEQANPLLESSREVAISTEKSTSKTHTTNLLSIKQVTARCSLSRSTIYALIKHGQFPKSYSIGARAVRFSEADINEWINQRIKKYDSSSTSSS